MFKTLGKELFSYKYLFAAPNQAPSRYDHWILYFGTALVILGLILWVVKLVSKATLQKNLLGRWVNLTFYIGLLLALWYWLRYQLVSFLSLHIVMLLILLIGIIWLVILIRYQAGTYNLAKKDFEREQLKRKYM